MFIVCYEHKMCGARGQKQAEKRSRPKHNKINQRRNLMDLIKIGAYIAEKRRALGITQVELARQLGMSDKSVSKWERGICLPDVSVYIQLCEILGISINEFIAGEDLDSDKIIQQSEKNIIDVTEAGKKKNNKMQKIIIFLAILYFISACWIALAQPYTRGNYIDTLEKDSQEMLVAEAVNEEDSIFGYRYYVENKCEKISFSVLEYVGEEFVANHYALAIDRDLYTGRSGTLVVLPDLEENKIKIKMITEKGTEPTEIPIDEIFEDYEQVLENHRPIKITNDIARTSDINKGEQIGLVRISCEAEDGSHPQHSYLLSVKFE